MQIDMKTYNLESFQDKDIYTLDEIVSIIEELESKNHHLEEELEELKQDITDNYRPISRAEQYGYSERDFI